MASLRDTHLQANAPAPPPPPPPPAPAALTAAATATATSGDSVNPTSASSNEAVAERATPATASITLPPRSGPPSTQLGSPHILRKELARAQVTVRRLLEDLEDLRAETERDRAAFVRAQQLFHDADLGRMAVAQELDLTKREQMKLEADAAEHERVLNEARSLQAFAERTLQAEMLKFKQLQDGWNAEKAVMALRIEDITRIETALEAERRRRSEVEMEAHNMKLKMMDATDTLRDEMNAASARETQLRAQLAEAVDLRTLAEERQNELDALLANARAELLHFRDQSVRNDAEGKAMKTKTSEAMEAQTRMLQQLRTAEADVEALAKERQELKKEVFTLKNALALKADQASHLSTTLGVTRSDALRKSEILESQRNTLITDRDNIARELDRVVQELTGSKLMVREAMMREESMNATLSKARKEMQKLRDEATILTHQSADAAKLRERVASMSAELAQHTRTKEMLDRAVERGDLMAAELTKVLELTKQYKEKNASLSTEVEMLQTELAVEKAASESMQAELRNHEARAREATEAETEAKNAMEKAQRQKEEASATATAAMKRQVDERQRADMLQQLVTKESTRANELEKVIVELKLNIDESKKKLKEMEDLDLTRTGEISRLSNVVAGLEKDIADAKSKEKGTYLEAETVRKYAADMEAAKIAAENATKNAVTAQKSAEKAREASSSDAETARRGKEKSDTMLGLAEMKIRELEGALASTKAELAGVKKVLLTTNERYNGALISINDMSKTLVTAQREIALLRNVNGMEKDNRGSNTRNLRGNRASGSMRQQISARTDEAAIANAGNGDDDESKTVTGVEDDRSISEPVRDGDGGEDGETPGGRTPMDKGDDNEDDDDNHDNDDDHDHDGDDDDGDTASPATSTPLSDLGLLTSPSSRSSSRAGRRRRLSTGLFNNPVKAAEEARAKEEQLQAIDKLHRSRLEIDALTVRIINTCSWHH